MTRADVAAITGTDGRDGFRYDGKLTVTYDLMEIWAWSSISYRDGHVVAQAWNVAHD